MIAYHQTLFYQNSIETAKRMRASSSAVVTFLMASTADAFVHSNICRRVMSLNLEDRIANM
jgi:hypothetical protein